MMAFKRGDKAVYPGFGVVEVTQVDANAVSLKVSGVSVRIPTDKIQQSGLRHIANKDAASEAFAALRERTEINRDLWVRRVKGYSAKLKSGSLFEVSEVVRDIMRLGKVKPLAFGERRMLDKAQLMLVGELALALGKPEDKVLGDIKKAVGR